MIPDPIYGWVKRLRYFLSGPYPSDDELERDPAFVPVLVELLDYPGSGYVRRKAATLLCLRSPEERRRGMAAFASELRRAESAYGRYVVACEFARAAAEHPEMDTPEAADLLQSVDLGADQSGRLAYQSLAQWFPPQSPVGNAIAGQRPAK